MRVIRNTTIMILLMSLLNTPVVLDAQNTNEWLHQKKTQIKYLLKQIAGLQLYIDLGQEGYRVAESGMGLISGCKNEEFNRHQQFFENRKTVKPNIKAIYHYSGP